MTLSAIEAHSGTLATPPPAGMAELFTAAQSPLRDLFDALPFLVIYLDREERYRFVNRAYEAWAQRSRADVLGLSAREVLGESLYARLRPYIARVLEGQQVEFDIDLDRPGGESRNLSIRYVPDKDRAGRVRGFLAHLSDVTSVRHQETKLRESQIRFRTIVEGSALGILETDRTGRVLFTNSEFRRMTGLTVGFCLEGDWTSALHPEDAGSFRARWAESLAGDLPLVCEFRLGLAASPRWVQFQSWPLVSDFGVCHVAAMQDITARRQAQERIAEHARAVQAANRRLEAQRRELLEANANLQRLRAQAETATRIKSDFLANMSHEIRTPMTAILGFTDVLCEALPAGGSTEAAEALRAIRRNGEHLLELINDILDVSKIEAGRMSVERLTFSPAQVVEEVVSLMQQRATAKNISLSMECAREAPTAMVSDPMRLRQILINLIGNAIKFTEFGGVRVVVSQDSSDRSRPMLAVDVIDSGIGIPPEKLGEIFDPFNQADSSTTRRFGGTGLGLTISRRLAALLGGHLSAASSTDSGSVFRLRVPTDSPPGTAATFDAPEAAAAPAPSAAEDAAPLASTTILVAEDGPDNQRLIAHVLRRAGARATVVENGQLAVDAALEALRAGMPFDVVLMDMQMPVMDGYEAVRRLRQAGYDRPIIALTAHAMSEDRQKCLRAGTDEYDTKPIHRQRLIGLIRRFIKPPNGAST